MPIVQLPDTLAPSVARLHGKIAVYVEDGPDHQGFLLDPAQATQTSLRILRTANDLAGGDDAPAFDVEHFNGTLATDASGERFARLALTVHGCDLVLSLNPAETAELAAALAVASRALDRSGPPKRDT